MHVKLLDCTLRDGGYYNAWDFDRDLVESYLQAMTALEVDYVELGFRFTSTDGFKGALAYTTDSYINELQVPDGLRLGVMLNASDVVNYSGGIEAALERLFDSAGESPVMLVRLACHIHEFEQALDAGRWLKDRGYIVGINLMQIADRTDEEIEAVAALAEGSAVEVLYFADSLGGLNPDRTAHIIQRLRTHWTGALGIHTHDNMGNALANSMRAIQEGVTWIDGTVTGMGRGPGNAKTEYLALELAPYRGRAGNITPLLNLIDRVFRPMQQEYGWGTNAYYYLAGKYGIHPTYIQQMLDDSRYGAADLQAVIDHLSAEGGKKFSVDMLENSRQFYRGEPRGTWRPRDLMEGREVLILGTGPGVEKHRLAIETFVRTARPVVVALNTQSSIDAELIDVRAACHPVRLLADGPTHARLPQPLVTPASMLPEHVRAGLRNKELLDYGMTVEEGTLSYAETFCTLPTSLVVPYAFAMSLSGRASRILLAGFDGYPAGDPRNAEMEWVLQVFRKSSMNFDPVSLTPTKYPLANTSVYAMV
ncbi:MAG: aldolase catalytic domain-containing protein [Rhodothermales bacterium]